VASKIQIKKLKRRPVSPKKSEKKLVIIDKSNKCEDQEEE
jgi:hypothetical protein